jgi:DnaJ-class molecular chaperone
MAGRQLMSAVTELVLKICGRCRGLGVVRRLDVEVGWSAIHALCPTCSGRGTVTLIGPTRTILKLES